MPLDPGHGFPWAQELDDLGLEQADDALQAGIAERYAAAAQAERAAQGKDTGTVRTQDGDVVIVADLPKRVTRDHAKLAAIVERIRTAGDAPTQYVEIAFKVPERCYAAWPEAIRQQFEPASTPQPATGPAWLNP